MNTTFLPYSPPRVLFNAHLETIYPSLFRKVDAPVYVRERIKTSDDDFLDLDWMTHAAPGLVKKNDPALVIISHGLEGNAQRAYVRGMAKAFYNAGTDVLAWNFRSCSGEINHKLRFYHGGASDDLGEVVSYALSLGKWSQLFLVGFSMGGNITLKYLGERGSLIAPQIKKSVVFSVPMDLVKSSVKLSIPSNFIYARRFLKSLKNKVKAKAPLQSALDLKGIEAIADLMSFDNRYTAPIHGFKDALDYYEKSSSVRFVTAITIPTLIVNAKNDPFLTPECSPVALLNGHPCVTLETPDFGGHVGFSLFSANGLYWSELRALHFIQP